MLLNILQYTLIPSVRSVKVENPDVNELSRPVSGGMVRLLFLFIPWRRCVPFMKLSGKGSICNTMH
jgi:hypothetical protein